MHPRNNYIFENGELVDIIQSTDPFLETHLHFIVVPFIDVEGEEIYEQSVLAISRDG